jgi:flagellar export protein FliJ
LEFAGAFAEIPRGGSALPAELERAVAAAQTAVARCVAETDEARVPLLEAVANRKAIEALKKRRLAEYDAREARKEERELDEANLG